MANFQHFNVKIFATQKEGVDLTPAIPVFHRWIQQSARPELLVDVADYRHVPAGPGVLLIGHEANYSLDQNNYRLGLLYNRMTPLEGSVADRLAQAWQSALEAAARIEQEPEFHDKLRFNAGEVEIILNDRLLSPNTEETYRELEPSVRSVFDSIYGGGAYTLEHVGEPRERLRITVQANREIPVADLAGQPV